MSQRLDVSISDYRIGQTRSGVRHTMEIAWPESSEVRMRFRSENDSCDREPMLTCDLFGCMLTQ